MTRTKFAETVRRQQRQDRLFWGIWTTVLFSLLVINISVTKLIPENYSLVYRVLFFAFLFIAIVLTVLIVRQRARSAGICCSLCQKPLSNMELNLLLRRVIAGLVAKSSLKINCVAV